MLCSTQRPTSRTAGVSCSTLYWFVRRGRLHPYLPQGRTIGWHFLPDEVDALAQGMGHPVPTMQVMSATEDELAQLLHTGNGPARATNTSRAAYTEGNSRSMASTHQKPHDATTTRT